MGVYNSYRGGGPCWTRKRGYHTPARMPAHIMRIIAGASQGIEARSATTAGRGPKDESPVSEGNAPENKGLS